MARTSPLVGQSKTLNRGKSTQPDLTESGSQTTQLSTIALFCKAAELGSFSAAAQAIGITPAAVSRGIGRLEARLGLKLFRRTTRSVQLTDDGRIYFEQCRAALAQIEDAERTITGQHDQPKGLLRVSAPSTYAHYRLLPLLPAFHELYPAIQIEVNISNRNIDFVDEGYDLAIRLGAPPQSRLIARKLEDARLGVYASPAYLAKRGMPKSPDQLRDGSHACLPFVRPSTGRVLPWLFEVDGVATELSPHSSVLISEGPLGCVALARAGIGLVQTYSWIGQAHAGELKEVLTRFAGATRPFYLLYPQNKLLSHRVRVMIDYLTEAAR